MWKKFANRQKRKNTQNRRKSSTLKYCLYFLYFLINLSNRDLPIRLNLMIKSWLRLIFGLAFLCARLTYIDKICTFFHVTSSPPSLPSILLFIFIWDRWNIICHILFVTGWLTDHVIILSWCWWLSKMAHIYMDAYFRTMT